MRNLLCYFNILVITVFTCWLSDLLYSEYFQKTLQVYDGVMYEKQQILRYLNFKGNYSLIERYNQFVYELTGSPVGGGFTALTCLINPKWLNTGFNVHVRSVIALFFFLFALYKLFSLYLKPIGVWGVILLTTQFPLFYHYRFGLASYVPDLSTGLALASAYILTWLVIKAKVNKYYLILVPFLLTIGLFSRYNFYVYTGLLFVTLIPSYISFLRQLDKNWYFYLLNFLFFFFLVVWICYGKLHFNFFLQYYTKPAEYQHVDFSTSFISLSDFLKNEFGWYGIVWILSISLVINSNKLEGKSLLLRELFQLIYPAIILFFFLFILLKATNQPHVFAAFFVFVLLGAIGGILYSKWNTRFLKRKKMNIIAISFCLLAAVIWNQYSFNLKLKEVQVDELSQNNFQLAKFLERNIKPGEKYFLMHDAMLEIPIDVYIYRSKGYWLDNKLMFYKTDWNYYEISKTLDVSVITDYYCKHLNSEKVSYITVPRQFPKNIVANKVFRKLKSSYFKSLAKVAGLSIAPFDILKKN